MTHLQERVMKTLSQILDAKPTELLTIRPQDSVLVALEVLATYNIGALPVVDGHKLVGIFSERDYARKVALKGLSSATTELHDVMTPAVQCATLNQTVTECMALMTDKRIRHLPVLDKGQLVGIVSIGDMVKAVIEDQRQHIEQLESYITNG